MMTATVKLLDVPTEPVPLPEPVAVKYAFGLRAHIMRMNIGNDRRGRAGAVTSWKPVVKVERGHRRANHKGCKAKVGHSHV